MSSCNRYHFLLLCLLFVSEVGICTVAGVATEGSEPFMREQKGFRTRVTTLGDTNQINKIL